MRIKRDKICEAMPVRSSRSQLAFPLDVSGSETRGWVSVLGNLTSWPLGWQSLLLTATQSLHWEPGWPLSAAFTLRCPCL